MKNTSIFRLMPLGIFLMLLFSSMQIHAQFSQVYGNSSNNFFNRLIPDGQDFYVLGRDDGKATVSRINSAGVLSWTRVLDMPSRLTDGMVVGGSGNMIVVGATTPVDSSNHSLLCEITRQGVFTCLKTLDVPGAEALTRMDRNANGTFSVVGTQSLPGFAQDVFVLNVSPGCLINSKKVISSPGVDNFANDIKVLCNGDFLVAGDYDGRAVMFEFSPTGQYVTGSHNPFNYTYNDIANTSNCDILVVANSLVSAPPIIQRFDADWLPLWEASIVGLQTLNKVVEDGNGNILVTGRALIGGITRTVIIKIDDSNGSPTLSWGGARYLDNNENSFVAGSIALPVAGGIAIIDGRDGNPNGFGMPDAFMAYTDDDLTSDCTRDLVLDVVIESTLFEGPIIEIFNYDVPPETMVTYSSVDWEQREACSGNPNPDSCVCSMPEFSLTYDGVDYPLSCLPHGGQTPVVGCANGLVTTGGFFGCIDPNTGEPCLIETPVVWLLSGPNGPIDGGTGSNYSAYIFPPSYFQTNGTYTLTMATLCPGQQDSCICTLDWIVECNSESIFKCGMAVTTYQSISNPLHKVLSVRDVRNHCPQPQLSNWLAPEITFPDWDVAHLGEIFGIAYDKFNNIYVCATSAYANAWPTNLPYGPAGSGGIYKISSFDGSVSNFVTTATCCGSTIGTSTIPNVLAGLGNICYDQSNNQFFVTNLEDGKIYRIDATSGVVIDTYDPFSVDNGIPGISCEGERIWGIGIYGSKLYFSQCNQSGTVSVGPNKIYSLSLGSGGTFPPSGSEISEITLPPISTTYPYSNPVSDIEFGANGRMILAEHSERGLPCQPVVIAHASRALEYVGAPGPLSPSANQFSIGVANYNNSAGGADYGYKCFDPLTQGIGKCDEMLWVSGDALILSSPVYCYGIAGIPSSGNSPSALNSWFVDDDSNLGPGDKMRIGDVDILHCGCPAESSLCDSISVTSTPSLVQNDSCCFVLAVSNFKPNYFTGISLCAQNGVSISSVALTNSWSMAGFSANMVSVIPPNNFVGTGTQDFIRFCLSNYQNVSNQQIIVKYYGPDLKVVCMDTLNFQCTQKPKCLKIIADTVTCAENGTYNLDFCVMANQLIGFTASSFQLNPPSGITFTPSAFQLTPGLLAGQMRCIFNTQISGAVDGQTFCFSVTAHREDITLGQAPLECCTDTVMQVCITMPSCVCNNLSAIATYVPSETDTCCWKVSLTNGYSNTYFTGIKLDILTTGVIFGAIKNTIGSGWNLNYLPKVATFTKLPLGTFVGSNAMLPEFCLSGITSSSQVPQEIQISWLGPDGKVVCLDTLYFECPPPVKVPCAALVNSRISCTDINSVYDFTFQVKNNSGFNINQIVFNNLTPLNSVVPDHFLIPVVSNTNTSIPVTASVFGSPGSTICFDLTVHELSQDTLELNCCTNSDEYCFTLPYCDTCFCATPSFTNLFLRGPGGPSIPIQCETSYENIGCPDPGYGFTLTGLFECAGDSCDTQPYVYWDLIGPLGGSVASGSTPGPYFGVNLLPAYFAQAGIYTMKLVGFCNFDTCTCEFQFIVDCPTQCPCEPTDISALGAAVSQGFSQILFPNSCKACFSPGALSDCETVEWYLNNTSGTPIGSSQGNSTFCYTFPGPGTYTVVMAVNRKKPDGTNCETFTESQTVKIFCLAQPGCKNSVFANSGFDEGAVVGGLNSGGFSSGWLGSFGDPVVVNEEEGSLDGWSVDLSGNLEEYDVLTSESAICVNKDTVVIMLRGIINTTRSNIKEPSPNRPCDKLVVSMNNGSPILPDICPDDQCIKLATIDLGPLYPTESSDTSESFEVQATFDLRDWMTVDSCSGITNSLMVRPTIYVTNGLSDDQGPETRTYIQIDNFCVEGETVAVEEITHKQEVKVFPNPTNGVLRIEMPFLSYNDISLQITSLTGQQLHVQKAEPGIAVQKMDASLLPQGMYFLQILSKGQVIAVNKFVKQ